jgi:hypothetical protein
MVVHSPIGSHVNDDKALDFNHLATPTPSVLTQQSYRGPTVYEQRRFGLGTRPDIGPFDGVDWASDHLTSVYPRPSEVDDES